MRAARAGLRTPFVHPSPGRRYQSRRVGVEVTGPPDSGPPLVRVRQPRIWAWRTHHDEATPAHARAGGPPWPCGWAARARPTTWWGPSRRWSPSAARRPTCAWTTVPSWWRGRWGTGADWLAPAPPTSNRARRGRHRGWSRSTAGPATSCSTSRSSARSPGQGHHRGVAAGVQPLPAALRPG